jgi:outer membrane lipopolysaccharide assembly protein LptE/RlpB
VPLRRALAWLAIALVATGCGYSIVRTGGSLGDVRSVAIPSPRNDSWEPGAEYVVADALRREFLRRRGARLIEDPARADLVLLGNVRSVGSHPASVDSLALALEYELLVELDLRAQRRGGGDVPIDLGALRESERYLVSADPEATRKNREEALRQVAGVLAGRVYVVLQETLEREGAAAASGTAP